MTQAKNDLAEKALLASLFNNSTVIGDVSELLSAQEFFEPKHELIYLTILKLYEHGRDSDPVSVVGELQKEGILSQAGDIMYIRELVNPNELSSMGSDPIGFALIIKENARLRELNDAGREIEKISTPGQGMTADEATQQAEQQILNIINKDASSAAMKTVAELLPEVIQTVKNAAELPTDSVAGIPSGFNDLDKKTNGFKPGQLCLIAARPAVGKLLNVQELIPTPDGTKHVGEIINGDKVFGPDGKIYNVVKAHDVIERLNSYEITFSDKTKIIAGEKHLWLTETHTKQNRSIENNIILSQQKINNLKKEIKTTNNGDTLSLTQLAKIVNKSTPNKTMIEIASHLNPVSYKFVTVNISQECKTHDVNNSSEIAMNHKLLIHIHEEAVLLKKISEIVHTSSSKKQLTVAEISSHLFGDKVSTNAYSYIAKLVNKDNLAYFSEQADVSDEVRVLYDSKELLEAYYAYIIKIKDNQKHDHVEISVKTTLEILNTLQSYSENYSNHSITVTKPLILPEADLPVTPYTFGTWLGEDDSIRRNVSPKGIPNIYLRSSVEQRKALLSGLMDTGGYADSYSSMVSFSQANEFLVDNIFDLVCSLGYCPVKSYSSKQYNNKLFSSWTVSWFTTDGIFRLPSKLVTHYEGFTHNPENTDCRYIVDIKKVDSLPMRCLTVDSPDSLFLVGKSMIATHNSTLAVDFARNAAFLAGKTVLFFSLEMGAEELVTRILSAEARVETSLLKTGQLSETDWMNIADAKEKLNNGTFLIDDSPKTSLSRIRSVATRQALKPEGLDMIIIDYLGLMEIPNSGRRNDSRQNDISELSRGLKILAKELQVPLIALSQLNRKAEERQDGVPKISDLRESGSLEQDADIVLLIHRPEATDENNRPGEADLIIGKHRGGPTGKISLTSMLAFSKFVAGQGLTSREPNFPSENKNGQFATSEDELPW